MSGRHGTVKFDNGAVRKPHFEIGEGLLLDDGNVIVRTNDDGVITYWRCHVDTHFNSPFYAEVVVQDLHVNPEKSCKFCLTTTLTRTRITHNLNKLFRSLGNQRALPFPDGIEINQIRPHTECRRTSANKIPRRLERHAARRHQLDVRQRSLQRFQITRPANRARRKHLHEISARIPRLDHLRRRQRTRHHCDVQSPATGNRFNIERRTHNKLRPTRNARRRRLRIKHCPRANQRILPITIRDLFDELHRARHSHRDLEHGNPTLTNRIDRAHRFIRTRCAHHRYHTRVSDPCNRLGFTHPCNPWLSFTSQRAPSHPSSRARLPPTSPSSYHQAS